MEPNEETISEKKTLILLVESEPNARNYLSTAIKSSDNFDVLNSGSIRDTMEILKENYEKIDFILFNWNSIEIPGSTFSQNIRKIYNYDHIELIAISQNLTPDDTFLIAELDIHYTLPKVINRADLIKKLEEVRKDYHFTKPELQKINELKHFINLENLEKCEEIVKDEKVLYKIKNNHKFLYLKGELLILRRQYEEAIQFFNSMLKDKSKLNTFETLKTMNTLGKAYCLAGKNKEALMIFEKLEAKSPKNLNHKVMVGEALLGLDKTYEAETKFHEVLEKNKKDKSALTGLIKSKSISGKYEEAKLFYHQIEGDFESKSLASYFNNRGVVLVKSDKFDEAISFYKNALYFFKKYKDHINFNLGMAYYRSNRIEEAVDYFQEVLKSDDFESFADKTLLKLLKEEGADKFIEKFKKSTTQIP
ncbi:tetratricopeptide repeat protein [Silvanigrella sp.]|jgi:tetratricopeptide (TPR) repeat protein|uniref:tetratricopeptide repeat protein n=1 Tax=Silvanigrella sp. TaxID=2024976 RepID=UPI0037C71D44